MSDSKECHANNSDIISKCLSIFDSVKSTEKKYLKSSHGIAAARVREIMDKRDLKNELKEVWEH